MADTDWLGPESNSHKEKSPDNNQINGSGMSAVLANQSDGYQDSIQAGIDDGAHAVIDLDAAAFNLSVVRAMAPDSKVMAVVKANAYGHGAIEIARTLANADGFGVARIAEARQLRDAGIVNPITLLEGFTDQHQLMTIIEIMADVVVHSIAQVDLLKRTGFSGNIWVKVTSGMNRLGFPLDMLPRVLHELRKYKVLGIMTHLANADMDTSATHRQIELFYKGVSEFGLPVSIANSAGIIRHPETRTDWVRPGLMLYGASPFPGQQFADLKTVMTLNAPVIAINRVRAGESVGYGSMWTAPVDCRVAVLAIGYADGYPWGTGNPRCVLLGGQRRQIVGRISMDMTCIVLADEDDVQLSERAILWGNRLPVEEVALASGSIAYTLLCQIGHRVTRLYVGDSEDAAK